jgi:L-fuculose-phosphate aldolase
MKNMKNGGVMNIQDLKETIIDIGKRMYSKEWIAANDGNISVKIAENRVLMTPTRQSKGFMTPEMLTIIDFEGNIVEGTYKPSSESLMHLSVYKARPDINAVVHAHPPVSTAFAVAGIPFDKFILPETILELGKVPIAPYATPGTPELSESFKDIIDSHDCFLLKNHGAVSLGDDLMTAYYKMDSLELMAKIVFHATLLGNVDEIPKDKVDVLVNRRSVYGIKGRQPEF